MRLSIVNKRGFSVLRTLEIQLKNGYYKSPPPEYEFMKRYPPVSRDKGAQFKEVKPEYVPYVKYYKGALERNPALVGEHVYPAYWRQQPLALTIAKKQYEYVLQGISEEKAYHKAVAFVDLQEGKSYDIMKELVQEVEKSTNARKSFVADPELAEIIQLWKNKLSKVPYSDLELHEQGELDFFIQTKILKWKEVERERRMKDPIYFNQFIKLRNTIFPQIGTNKNKDKEKMLKDAYKKQQLVMNGMNPELVRTRSPFFYDDYINYFNKLKVQPLIAKWSLVERQGLSKWIHQALSFQHMLDDDTLDNYSKQRYLDCMRGQFFPMVQYTTRVKEFQLPSIDQLKALLYDNDVGYKRVSGKLFIKRFYKLPSLLFPVETLMTSLIMTRNGLSDMSEEQIEKEVSDEVQTAGLDTSIIPTIMTRLQEYHTNIAAALHSENQDRFRDSSNGSDGNGGDSGTSIDMSFLDDMIRAESANNNNMTTYDEEEEQENSNRIKRKAGVRGVDDEILDMIAKTDSQADLSSVDGDDDIDDDDEFMMDDAAAVDDDKGEKEGKKNNDENDEEEDDEEEEEEEISYTSIISSTSDMNSKKPERHAIFQSPHKNHLSDEEWSDVVQNYVKIPQTQLDRERDEFYKRMEYFDWQDAETEAELYNFKRIRVENEIILKARLELIYEHKEAARRRVEWRRRRVWSAKQLGPLSLTLID